MTESKKSQVINTEEPEKIFLFQREVIVLRIGMTRTPDGKWEVTDDDYDNAKIVSDRVVKEWFEDEEGNELEMEEWETVND